MATERLDTVRARARDEAMRRGINPRDVDVLLSDLLEQPLAFLFAHGETPLDPETFAPILERRFAGEPLQYIRRRTEFYSREFYVDNRVLIPRPETEVLVEAALETAPGRGRVIDVGTGSGCIAISIERSRPDLRVIGVDRSVGALRVAAINRDRLRARVHLMASDLLASVRGEADLIVSNPPYIASADIEGLAAEVRLHEPRVALAAGPRGTEMIERLFDEVRLRLARGGKLVIEIGYGQETLIREIARSMAFAIEMVINDLAAIPRVVVLSRD